MHGQGYDGCSVMMGHLTGVATQLRQIEPTALQVHCFAHSLNLCLQDAAKLCVIVRDCLGLVYEMLQLIKYSPKHYLVFEKCQKEFSPESPGLRPLCPTRWTVHTGALDSILKNYETFIHTFGEINTTSHDDYGRRSGGVMTQLELFPTYFGFRLCHLVFAITEEVSLFLQSKNIMLQDAVGQVNVARRCLERHRTDEAYNLFYENCLNDSNLLTNPPCLPRARRPPRRIDSDSEPHVFETPLEYYRKIYFEVIDVVVDELNRRFDQPSLQIPLAIERLILEAANWDVPGSLQIDNELLKCYERDLDPSKLQRQLNMLPDLIKEPKSTPSFMHLKQCLNDC